MSEDSSSSKDKGFFMKIIVGFLVGAFLIYLPLHTVVQRPEARPIVLCDDVYSLTSFIWVDVLNFFQPNNHVGKTEHIIDVNNLRHKCLAYANDATWLIKIPYPSFLFGDDY